MNASQRLWVDDGLTGSYVFTFQSDSDDVVPKSASRTSPLISCKPVCGEFPG